MLAVFFCKSSIVITRYTAAHLAFCFLVIMLTLKSYSPMAFQLAFCFLSVCIVFTFGATSGDIGE